MTDMRRRHQHDDFTTRYPTTQLHLILPLYFATTPHPIIEEDKLVA